MIINCKIGNYSSDLAICSFYWVGRCIQEKASENKDSLTRVFWMLFLRTASGKTKGRASTHRYIPKAKPVFQVHSSSSCRKQSTKGLKFGFDSFCTGLLFQCSSFFSSWFKQRLNSTSSAEFGCRDCIGY